MTDAEFHDATLNYAKKFNKSYSEAANAVKELEITVLAGRQLPTAPPAGTGAALSDAELDLQAKAYAKENNLSYGEAIGVVCNFEGSSFSASSKRSAAHAMASLPVGPSSDAQLDTLAKAYAKIHSLSYAEAIGAVCDQALTSFDQMASFSEPWQGQVDHQATRILEGQQIEIFKAGRHTSEGGQVLDFSASDIRAMAMAYTPAAREAPLVVGHPQNNLPAYGWVKGLTATDDGRLLMQAGQVMPAFAQMVKDGRFKKRSACFYPPNAPGNPRPGSWYLRHVGWLGAQQPAVAGLKDVSL